MSNLSELNKVSIKLQNHVIDLEEKFDALKEKFNRTQVLFENLILRKSGREKHLKSKFKALESAIGGIFDTMVLKFHRYRENQKVVGG